MKIHIVKKGETLGKIARMYQVNVQKLLAVNPHIKDPDQILPRTKVKVPTAGVPLKPKRTALPMEENQWQPASHTENEMQSSAMETGVDEKETQSATLDESSTQERDMHGKQMESFAASDLESSAVGLPGSDIPPYPGYTSYPGYASYYPSHMPYYSGYMPYASYMSNAGYAPYAYSGWTEYPYANTMNWPGYYPVGAAWGQQQTFYAHPVQRMYHLPDWWNPENDDGEDSGEEGI